MCRKNFFSSFKNQKHFFWSQYRARKKNEKQNENKYNFMTSTSLGYCSERALNKQQNSLSRLSPSTLTSFFLFYFSSFHIHFIRFLSIGISLRFSEFSDFCSQFSSFVGLFRQQRITESFFSLLVRRRRQRRRAELQIFP